MPAADRVGLPPLQGAPCVLLKLGEVVLKGRNRQHFERLLHGNIKRAIRELGLRVRIWQRDGVLVLLAAPDNGRPGEGAWSAQAADAVADRMLDVMGVARVCRALRVPKDLMSAVAAAVGLAAGRDGSFAVRARRRDKRFPMTSADIAIAIGAAVQREFGNPVDLSRPDFTIFVEVDQSEIFVFTDRPAGQGGLPVSMSGRALVLISGGIDSPVAAYRMMRRGLYCSFLHFSGMPLTGPESVYKAYGLVRQLDKFQGGSRLHVVAFGSAQRQLAACGAGRLQIMAQRRLMLRTAQELARRLRMSALVTGDSLGQVSSQTLTNITALDDAVTLPILRPLIAMDKTEIMAEARRIRTLELSELPDEDCCSLLLPRQAETRARIEDLRRIEARLDISKLAAELASAAQEHRPGTAIAPAGKQALTDQEGAT